MLANFSNSAGDVAGDVAADVDDVIVTVGDVTSVNGGLSGITGAVSVNGGLIGTTGAVSGKICGGDGKEALAAADEVFGNCETYVCGAAA